MPTDTKSPRIRPSDGLRSSPGHLEPASGLKRQRIRPAGVRDSDRANSIIIPKTRRSIPKASYRCSPTALFSGVCSIPARQARAVRNPDIGSWLRLIRMCIRPRVRPASGSSSSRASCPKRCRVNRPRGDFDVHPAALAAVSAQALGNPATQATRAAAISAGESSCRK